MATTLVITTCGTDPTSTVVLRVIGEVDVASAGSLRAAIRSVLSQAGGPIVVDCAGMTFIDASGLGIFVWMANEARKQRRDVSLRNLNEPTQRLVHITGLAGRFGVELAESA